MSAPLSQSPALSPAFSTRVVLAMVGLGTILFLALLFMIGSGNGMLGNTNNGGAHAGGKGLNGYAGLVSLMQAAGYETTLSRSEAGLKQPGLLVLTPPQNAKGEEIERIVTLHRAYGPVLVVTPKWQASLLPNRVKAAKKGWVQLGDPAAPNWPGFLDDVRLHNTDLGASGHWVAGDLIGALPAPKQVLSGYGGGLVPLVTTQEDGRMLAGFIADGNFPALAELSQTVVQAEGDAVQKFPLVVVFEPDLLDNYGMANAANAALAERIFTATSLGSPRHILFDISMNGFARKANLLTLAFTPPYLAATLCLILAALAMGWRAFVRFGPAAMPPRAIAYGKQALASNSAGLIARTGRLYLLGAPYAALRRDRLLALLGLPRMADQTAAEALLDQALERRSLAPFSPLAHALRNARRPHDLLRAAQNLDSLERTISA